MSHVREACFKGAYLLHFIGNSYHAEKLILVCVNTRTEFSAADIQGAFGLAFGNKITTCQEFDDKMAQNPLRICTPLSKVPAMRVIEYVLSLRTLLRIACIASKCWLTQS